MDIKRYNISEDFYFQNIQRAIDENLITHEKDICLYIHNPFCVKECAFCIYHAQTLCKEEYNHFYKEALPTQLKFIFDNLKNVRIDKLYFGGGTASLMPEYTYEKIKEIVPDFDKIRFKATEVNPCFYSEHFRKAIITDGFNYVSFGVQSFDKEVLELNERKHISLDKLRNVAESFRENGIYINVDLLTFIYHCGDKDIEVLTSDLDILLEAGIADSVTIYPNYNFLNKLSKKEKYRVIALLRKKMFDITQNHSTYETDISFIPTELDLYTDYHIIKKGNIIDRYNCSGLAYSHLTKNQITVSAGAYKGAAVYSYTGDFKCYEIYDDKRSYKLRFDIVKDLYEEG